MPHKFDVSRVAVLEDEGRKGFLPAVEILERIGVKEGLIFADIGCGTGYFSIPASELVGRGRVYAIDVQAGMLALLRKKAKNKNIIIVKSTESKIPLPKETADIAFMGDVLHELEGLGTLMEAHRILVGRGILAIVDWKKEDMEVGPPLAERLTLEEAEKRVEKAGFRVKESFEVPPYHYGMLARK